jgi:hypothetical protein
MLQIISDLVGIEMGNVLFTIGCLHGFEFKKSKFPEVKMGSFKYPSGNLTLRDMDNLMAIMVEFVSRLDDKSLGRVNPFEKDDRIQLWQDYANVFRVYKAEQLKIKIDIPHFFHPQLRFIYKGE